jgi:hypothetical protein
MRNHTANGLEENAGGCAVVEGTRLPWVDNVAFVKEVVVAQLIAGGKDEVYRLPQYDMKYVQSDVLQFCNVDLSLTHLVAEEATRDIDLFASNNDDLLTRKRLLGDYGCQATQEMSFAVDDNRRRGECGHFRGGAVSTTAR